MNVLKIVLVGSAALVASAPAAAAVTTFATFSDPTTADNFRFVNTGNSSNASRTTDATLYSTSTASAPGPGRRSFGSASCSRSSCRM